MHYQRWRLHGDPLYERPRTDGCSIEGCDRPHKSKGWCDAHYQNWKRTGSPLGLKTKSLAEKFWDRVNKHGPRHPQWGYCWVWTGKIKPGLSGGYGILYAGEEGDLRANRVSWELHYGPVLDDLCVLHKCDNRACVRPTHLFLGTRKENTDDMVAKGRYVNGMAGRKESAEHKRWRADRVAKDYRLRAPDGTVVDVHNLRSFALANGLDPSGLRKAASGEYSQHKGWSQA